MGFFDKTIRKGGNELVEFYVGFIFGSILAGLIGYIIGYSVSRKKYSTKYGGYLKAYKTEPNESPSLFLDLDMIPEEIMKSEYVTFRVSLK